MDKREATVSWYLRKAIFFGPFRFNLSKGGIGASVGVTGLRLGSGPRGSYVHMGRGGLYARVPLGGPTPTDSNEPVDGGYLDRYESGAADSLRPSSREEFLGHVNRSAAAFRMATHVSLGGLLLAAGVAWSKGGPTGWWILMTSLGLAALLLYLGLARRVTVKLAVDEGTSELLQAISDTLQTAIDNSSLWHLDESKTVQAVGHPDGITMAKKRSAPAGIGSTRSLVIQPPVPWVGVGRQRLYFMPDQVLVTDHWGVGTVPYDELYLQTSPVTLADRGQRPPTVQSAGITWPHTRKDGGPDRRYADNPSVPLGAYWQLTIESADGLREALLFADREHADALSRALRALANIQTTFTKLSPEGDG